MTGRRKGTPCACETDPCSCGSSKGKCIRTINNISPDANGDIFIDAGIGVTITQIGDNTFQISFDGTPSQPMVFKGTVGSGGTVSVLPAADPDNIGWTYIAIEDGTVPVTYAAGDTLVSNGYTWVVIPSGDDPVDWSQILNTPDTIAGYGITDAYTKSEVYSKAETDAIDDTKLDKRTTAGQQVYIHTGATQGDQLLSINAQALSVAQRGVNGELFGANAPAGSTDNTLANTNWVSQTGDSAPNNLVHKTGNETKTGQLMLRSADALRAITNATYNNIILGSTTLYNRIISRKYNADMSKNDLHFELGSTYVTSTSNYIHLQAAAPRITFGDTSENQMKIDIAIRSNNDGTGSVYLIATKPDGTQKTKIISSFDGTDWS